jgi:hypothetical protein
MKFVSYRQGRQKGAQPLNFLNHTYFLIVIFDRLFRRSIVNKLIRISNDTLCLRFRLTANLVDFKNSIRHIPPVFFALGITRQGLDNTKKNGTNQAKSWHHQL